MAKHLNQQDIKAIIDIINGWKSEKITWNSICEAANSVVGKVPTRQSLNDHKEIVLAYKTRKKRLKETSPNTPKPSNLNVAVEQVSKLQRKVEVLEEQNRLLNQQFVIWQYNAYKKGLTQRDLFEPLPLIDRERGDLERR